MKFSKAFLITALAAYANGFELLRDAANGFRIGAATNTIHYNNGNYINAMKAFNYMVAENACKFESIQRNKGQFNFNDCDNHLKKAKELGMDFRGHALIWHSQAPQWIHGERGDQMKQSIINHVTKVLQHYEGKIDTWDVVNEAIDDSSNGNGWKLRPSFFYQGLPNFIDVAFEAARKASPTTKLFYNDYNTEGIYPKSESVYQFVADMKKRNIPIDGVGIQYHVGVNAQPKFEKINDLIGRYCKLGLEVHITELDVSCDNNCRDPDGGDGKQGEVYANALKACLGNECCTGFLVWGIGDSDSWRGAGKKPLLFSSNYQPKGQYNKLLEVLKTTPAACLKNKPAAGGAAGGAGAGAETPATGGQTTTTPGAPTTGGQTSTTPAAPATGAQGDGQCFATALNYKCCSECDIFYKDNDGFWGVENDQWCGITAKCNATDKSCIGKQGYKCCKSTCTVVTTDTDGDWGVENNQWCVIDKTKC